MSTPGTCTIACDVRPEVGLELHAPVCWQEQLIAEHAIRQAVEEDYEAAEALIDMLVDVIAEHDHQLAALREGLTQTDQALLAYRFPAGETLEELDHQASAAISVARALLAPPATDQQQPGDAAPQGAE